MSLHAQFERVVRMFQDSAILVAVSSTPEGFAGNKLIVLLIQELAGYRADDSRTSVMATSSDVSLNLTGSMVRISPESEYMDEVHTISKRSI